ncbi:helix-turn-helix transcriptional regulator [Amycolatopsis nigrescens]|uniref:helix-turn-helix transcriptional regulator n=1 Tax=Amycolatopsis nigrescens TaxID=381445 RepID=UPI00036A36B0|nr:helix-turn-helix transcriptional regulator [Amycolatopsis nigrescens]
MSQYSLARELVTASGRPTITRDLVARWERGHQIPRSGTRRWLSVVLQVPQEQLDLAAVAARRRTRLGHAIVTTNAPAQPGHARRAQGTPPLLPVFRSRVQAGILAATLLNPDRSFSLTELAEYAGSSLASVDKENKLLEDAGILTSRREGTIRLIRANNRTSSMVGPLTELIRLTYGVPQVIAEEFGCVPHVARIMLGGVWADRFAGIPGPEPDSFQLLVVVPPDKPLDRQALGTAVARTEERLRRPVHLSVVPLGQNLDTRQIPHQRPGHPVVEVVAVRPRSAQESAGVALEGQEEIKRLLRTGQLEMAGGPSANGRPFLRLAADHIDSAEPLTETSPKSAFVLLTRAAQLIGSALLAQQGLRPSAGAAEHIVGTAVTAQFGHQFSQIELLRQRSRELDTPTSSDSHAMPVEATTYLGTARSLLATATEQIDKVSLFS